MNLNVYKHYMHSRMLWMIQVNLELLGAQLSIRGFKEIKKTKMS